MENTRLNAQILFENRSVTLSLLTGSILLIAYKARALNDEYLQNLEKQIELVKKHKIAKAVFDLRKMGVLSLENQKYTAEVYMPEITKAGLKHSALIVPEDIFGEASAKNVNSKREEEVVFSIQYFKDLPEALDWITTIQNPVKK